MENTKQQSAVEWLEEQLFDSLGIELTEHQSKLANEIFFKQAKEMFEKQIIDACNQKEFEELDGMGIHETITKGEQYYEQTFKNK